LQESHRLNRYIQNLLDMTRFGQDRIAIQREWVDLHDLAAAAVERLDATAGPAPTVQIAREVALIFVHGALIEQALVNIVGNAMDFSDANGGIRIGAYLDGEDTVIDVVDEGPGIAPAERERVFDMFYRAEEGDERRHGVGLGLAICRSIVEAHGGTIEALAGDNDRGTCIRMRLPVAANPIGSGDA
jgi:two-component system sensor histidine kinase KdpD